MSNPIQEAIDKANAAAAQAAALQAQAAAMAVAAPAPATAVAVAPAPAPVKLTMETMSAGQMSVDQWIKVKEDGLKLGDKPGLIESMILGLDMTLDRGFRLKYAIKNGNPAQYAYSFDNATADGGGTWAAAIEKIQKLDPSKKCSPYRAVDLPFFVIEDVKKGDQVLAKIGDTLGHTTSTTNWANWEVFYKAVEAAGLMGQKVKVKVTAQPRTNTKGNTWGVLKFELLGLAPEDSEGE